MILWLFSFLPEQEAVVLASQQLPRYQLWKDPPSFMKATERQNVDHEQIPSQRCGPH